jgi:hypothetical protein
MRRDEPSRGQITMVSQADHIEAARQQLLNKRRDFEAEIREINTALEGLDTAARLITGKTGRGGPFKSEPEHVEKQRTLANRNVTKLVRERLDNYGKHDEKIDINEIRDDLKRQGVKGKDRSLYSAIHVIVKKEAEKRDDLSYKEGVGFFKSRDKVDRLTREDTGVGS